MNIKLKDVEHRLTLADRLDMERYEWAPLKVQEGKWYLTAAGVHIYVDTKGIRKNGKEFFTAWLDEKVEDGKRKRLEYPMTVFYSPSGEVARRKSKPYPSWFHPRWYRIVSLLKT